MKKVKIDKEYKSLIEAWVEDLRSHPELQGKGRLYRKDNGKFCCLGRLCVVEGADLDTLDHENWIEREFTDGYQPDVPQEFFDTESKWETLPDVLSNMNDGVDKYAALSLSEIWGYEFKEGKYTFPEIADFIEQVIEYI